MGIIAVAGGTGGVGRALVEAIARRGKHQVKILSRKANDSLAAELAVPIITVDYSSIEDLKRVFEDHKIDTVISALSTMPEEGIPPEVNMVRAAQESKATHRFIPSNWGIPLDEGYALKMPSTSMKLQALTELKKTSLEYTVFYAGFFTDFYTGPSIKTYLSPMVAVVDLAHNMAAIPGSGDTPIVFTHTFDLAKYVDAVLDLEKWEPEYYVMGDRVTWNEFVKLAETEKGTKFKIVYDSVEDLRNGVTTELPALTKALPFIPIPKEALLAFSATFGLLFDDGTFGFKDMEGKPLNVKFPEIVPLKVKQALEAAVKGT